MPERPIKSHGVCISQRIPHSKQIITRSLRSHPSCVDPKKRLPSPFHETVISRGWIALSLLLLGEISCVEDVGHAVDDVVELEQETVVLYESLDLFPKVLVRFDQGILVLLNLVP